MSVVPLMRALMPVPEPPPVTWMTVAGFFFMKFSAHRWPRITMVSEPLMVMDPAARAVPATATTAARANSESDSLRMMNSPR